MALHEEPTTVDRSDVAEVVGQLPHVEHMPVDEKRQSSDYSDEKLDNGKLEANIGRTETFDPEDNLYDENGKEKVLETPEDFATALVSLDDDPTLPVYTFRMWFAGIGLAVFGSVLGMLFVSTYSCVHLLCQSCL